LDTLELAQRVGWIRDGRDILTRGRVAEDAKTGWYVGRLSAGDPNRGDYETHRFSLVDDAGGRFKIVGEQLVVADAAKIEFEQAKTHQVVVRVTDRRGLYQDKAYCPPSALMRQMGRVEEGGGSGSS
jgi:hypothetical protein